MKHKSVIIIIMVALIVIPIISIALTYPYSESSYGGVDYGWAISAGSLNLNVNNRTLCQPFDAPKTGIIRNFYTNGQNTGATLVYCLSDSKVHPTVSGECVGVDGEYGSHTNEWLDLPENVSFLVSEGSRYYLCLSALVDATNTPLYYNTNNSYFDQSGNIHSDFSSVLISVPSTTGRTYLINENASYSDSGGAFTDYGFSTLADFQFCYDNSYTDCYTTGGTHAGVTNKIVITNNLRGEKFSWDFPDTNITNLAMMVGYGSGTSGNELFTMNIFEYNESTGFLGNIYESDVFNKTDLQGTGTTINKPYYFNHTLSSPISIEQGKQYIVGVNCTSGCVGTTDVLYTYGTVHNSNFAPYIIGFQGNETGQLTLISSGSVTTYPTEDAFFIIDTEATSLSPKQCQDGVDNDGDGFTDYPTDPSCSSITDDFETPFDYTQCNDGVDNDGDGNIDLADAYCTQASDTTEFPKDSSVQLNNTCIAGEFCIFKEIFPYTDNITFHGWTGTTSADLEVESIFGSYMLNLDGGASNITHNVTNANTYNTVQAWYDIYLELGDSWTYDTYTGYIRYLDVYDQEAIRLKYDLRRNASLDPDELQVTLSGYSYDLADYREITTFVAGFNADSRMQVMITIDQIDREYNVSYIDSNGFNKVDAIFNWSDISAWKINKINLENLNMSSSNLDIHIDNIQLFGSDVNFGTTCDTWEKPYYLVETFNGYPRVCDWITSYNIYANGILSVASDSPTFFMQKDLDKLMERSDTRYGTISFYLSSGSLSTGSTVTVRAYNEEDFNFLTLFLRDSGGNIWYNGDGEGVILYNNIPEDTSLLYQIIIDFQADTWKFRLNDTDVSSDLSFTNSFANIEDFEYIKISGNDADFTLDDLLIYASDSSGNPQLPDDDVTQILDDKKYICELFNAEEIHCTDDSECESGSCTRSGLCSVFDYTTCDENEKKRGFYCIGSEIVKCGLDSASNKILDNFLWFIMFLIILMGLIMLGFMLKSK